MKKSKKAQSKKNKKVVKAKPRIGRLEVSVDYLDHLKGKVSVEKAVADCDAIYVKAGHGDSNLKETKYSFDKAFKVLFRLKLLKIENGLISVIK